MKKIKFPIAILSILLFCLNVISYPNKMNYFQLATSQIQAAENQNKKVSRDWIFDYYGLTEEEVQDYDIDMIIRNDFLADKDTTMQRYPTKEVFLESLPWLYEGAYELEYADELQALNDFSYLLEGEADFPDDYGQIKHLGIESAWDDLQPNENDPTGVVSLFFDFDQNKAYYKSFNRSVLDDIRQAQNVVALSEEQVEEILKHLEKARFAEWPVFQSSEDTYDQWQYGLETKDGHVFSNQVENLDAIPQARDLFTQLFSYVSQVKGENHED